MPWEPRYSEAEIRDAVASMFSIRDALRRLGLRAVGGNPRTLKRHIVHYGVSIDHFDPYRSQRGPNVVRRIALDDVLVAGSSYNRGRLKRRLYEEGLKDRVCEMCGQDENWRGKRIALILDHVNGVGDDNQLENLRIVCPNCNATLDAHCGRRNQISREPIPCGRCETPFEPRYAAQRYCSLRCGARATRSHDPRPETRKVHRPPYDQLMAELAASNFCAVARRYGVSDNAVRKWVRWYEADRARREAS